MQSNESFRVSGRVLSVSDTQQVKDSFRKRDLVLEYYDHPTFRNYPQYLKFEATQERCILLDQVQPGAEVQVEFGLRGREWVNPKGEKVIFTSLALINVFPVHGGAPAPPPPADLRIDPLNELPEDDLPF